MIAHMAKPIDWKTKISAEYRFLVPSSSPASFAERLNLLFQTRLVDGRMLSNEAACKAIRDAGGPTISKSYLAELRSGAKDNPTRKHMQALAALFKVEPSFLIDETDEVEETMVRLRTELALQSKAKVEGAALRATAANTDLRDAVAEMRRQADEIERQLGYKGD